MEDLLALHGKWLVSRRKPEEMCHSDTLVELIAEAVELRTGTFNAHGEAPEASDASDSPLETSEDEAPPEEQAIEVEAVRKVTVPARVSNHPIQVRTF